MADTAFDNKTLAILHDQLGRVIPEKMDDNERQLAFKKDVYVKYVAEWGFYQAMDKAQVTTEFVKEMMASDPVWANKVYIGIMKTIEMGYTHATKIIKDMDVPATQKGATANLLAAILKAAAALYSGMIPQFKVETSDKGPTVININVQYEDKEIK